MVLVDQPLRERRGRPGPARRPSDTSSTAVATSASAPGEPSVGGVAVFGTEDLVGAVVGPVVGAVVAGPAVTGASPVQPRGSG